MLFNKRSKILLFFSLCTNVKLFCLLLFEKCFCFVVSSCHNVWQACSNVITSDAHVNKGLLDFFTKGTI